MRTTLYKKAEYAWDKEAEQIQVERSCERLQKKENEVRDQRYATRKLLDKNYASTMQSRFAITQAEKTPNLSGPVTIEALGSSYPVQKQKMQEADMRTTKHGLSVEGLFVKKTLKELTQETMTASPQRHKMPYPSDQLVEKRSM